MKSRYGTLGSSREVLSPSVRTKGSVQAEDLSVPRCVRVATPFRATSSTAAIVRLVIAAVASSVTYAHHTVPTVSPAVT